MKELIPFGAILGWSFLGGYRGYESYKGRYEKSMRSYNIEMGKARQVLSEMEKEFSELSGEEPVNKGDVFERVEKLQKKVGEFPVTDLDKKWKLDRIKSNLAYESRNGPLKKSPPPLYLYSSAGWHSLGTGFIYACVPFSIYFTLPFEIKRLEMWYRGLSKEDLKRPDDYYFMFL